MELIEVGYLLLGALISYLVGIRVYHHQRKIEEKEKSDRHKKMKKEIETSFSNPNISMYVDIKYEIGVQLILSNNTPWTIEIRNVTFHGENNYIHLPYTGERIGDSKTLQYSEVDNITKMPPFSEGKWLVPLMKEEISEYIFKQNYDNCTVKCEFNTVYGEVQLLEIQSSSEIANSITPLMKDCLEYRQKQNAQNNNSNKAKENNI